MTITPVKSSTVKHVGFASESGTLEVRFHSGDTYHYDDVSPAEHHALVTAKSVGQHLHAHVKSRYQGRKLDPADVR